MRLGSAVALVLVVASSSALAERVVILELEGDRKGALREQIEEAAQSGEGIDVVYLSEYRAAAKAKQLQGFAAMLPGAVARVSKGLRLSAAVTGKVSGESLKVIIYDPSGETLWTKTLALKKGRLPDQVLSKLIRAISVAAEQNPAANAPLAAAASPRVPVVGPSPPPLPPPSVEVAPKSDVGPAPAAESRTEERDADLDELSGRTQRKVRKIPLDIVRVWVAGATTWRSQCLRPGVTRCKDYDLAQTRPAGIAVDFNSTVPYLGITLNGEVFPFARFENWVLQGVGLVAGFHYGQSQTKLREESAQGAGADQTVKSDDIGYNAQLTWRYHFPLGIDLNREVGEPSRGLPVAWLGVRGGLMSRSFLIDLTTATALPSSDRLAPTGLGFPVIGLDASLPVIRHLRFDFSASYFIGPKPSDEQIIGYGNLKDATGGAVSTGFGLEAGISGAIWGPLGYVLHWRYQGFNDAYKGQGQKWTTCNETQCGGVGEESFHAVVWGVSVSY